MPEIVHLSSVHSRFDIRIFLKECCSLANAGYTVTLIVADGLGDEIRNNIRIFDVGSSRGRINRIFKVTHWVFKKAKRLDADLYHLHDPELIPVGLKLKRLGKQVIFDAHEDTPQQLLSKPYLNRLLRYLLAEVFSIFEKWACRRFDAILTATPFIRDKFVEINHNTVDINNYPILAEIDTIPDDWSAKARRVCYIGGIASIRGIREIVQAMQLVVHDDTRLQLAGRFSEPAVEREIKHYPGWSRVDDLGWLDRGEIRALLSRSVAGLVTLHPIASYLDALPVKMFEYMAAGIPVIASDFPLWRKIVQGAECGLLIDPLQPEKIAAAIDWLLDNPRQARQMGGNGRKAIENKYNWATEEKKLIHRYRKLIA